MLFKVVFFLGITSILFAGSLHLNKDDVFYEKYVKNAPNAKPLLVKDTDSAIGRENLYPKKLTVKMLARAHGHLCDGLVLAYVELANTLPKLFKDGIVDRTDVRVVAKNSPCLVDTSALMSGARINFKTLSLDNSLGGSFIVQRISTGKTFKVSLQSKDFTLRSDTVNKNVARK
jgi:formylmethanofuran dehydrogenase subunit E